eukprot:scaffold204137_cov31-Prasinocladus_malaysianus.AAC.1
MVTARLQQATIGLKLRVARLHAALINVSAATLCIAVAVPTTCAVPNSLFAVSFYYKLALDVKGTHTNRIRSAILVQKYGQRMTRTLSAHTSGTR